jgi:hypothetical protein
MSTIKHSINELILFAIYSLNKSSKKCTFQDLINECFSLFPKEFCFSKYPKWPDARKLDRSLRTLREKKMISGNLQTFFGLTSSGKKMAEEITKIFCQKKLL